MPTSIEEFMREDEIELGCLKDIPVLDIPCGLIYPKLATHFTGYYIFNLDPVFCDNCARMEQDDRFNKIYPGKEVY